ncbi:MAG TPA: outer membrane protein assembly factor BamB [Gammaproteobacteria bacterium]|jgi:outer membrane protein assembly factor BamB|nr:outer membrane protein assembly factor BamB [Gammaproteobacteria bacterium]
MRYTQYLIFAVVTLLLTACSGGFFDKDNTQPPAPLTSFTPEMKPQHLWSTKTGSGTGDEYLKMTPALNAAAIFTTSPRGMITAINKQNGHMIWQMHTGFSLSTGPGVGNGIVVAGGRRGDIIALSQLDGRRRWIAHINGEILAPPAVSERLVVVKATDGYVRALSTRNGEEIWSYKQLEPSLILRGASQPIIQGGAVIMGFANGNLSKHQLNNGDLLWEQTIATAEGAFAIQRMIDIDANPLVFEHNIYAATYQGKIASLDWAQGNVRWEHDISSYTGMVADANTVYLSDATSHLWAFNARTGQIQWRQNQLDARIITAPATTSRAIVVADAQGYVHLLRKSDGRIIGRISLGTAIYATPLVENDILYVFTSHGAIAAYQL